MLNDKILSSYNRLMGNHLGYTLIGRVLPATLFGLILGAKLLSLRSILSSGTADRAGFDALHYYALVTYQSMVLVFLATVCFLFVVRQPIVQGLKSVRGGIVAIAGTFFSTPLAFAPITLPQPWLVFTASTLMVLGTCFAFFALIHLGRCFGISPQARGLVTGGPYRWVRHPVYIGEQITTLGMLLPVISPWAVAVFLIHCALQFSRAQSEETVLEGAFPTYAKYRSRVARFVPRVY